MNSSLVSFYEPEWPKPPGVHALLTRRINRNDSDINSTEPNSSGINSSDIDSSDIDSSDIDSHGYAGFNLALHVGDNEQAVMKNRAELRVKLPSEPVWLNQIHGNSIVEVNQTSTYVHPLTADGSYTCAPTRVLTVLVADCMPILLASTDGSEIAVVHAGWRGLAAGVIETALSRFRSSAIIAWLGPAIGVCHLEVDAQVINAFPDTLGFHKGRDTEHWMLDMFEIARRRLTEAGVQRTYGGGLCNFCDRRYFSHRRDNPTGRFGVFIWREDS